MDSKNWRGLLIEIESLRQEERESVLVLIVVDES